LGAHAEISIIYLASVFRVDVVYIFGNMLDYRGMQKRRVVVKPK
jgi:hypothetical protein